MKRLLQAFLLFIPLWAFSQQEGDNFNQYNGIHEIRLTFYQQNYWDSLIDGYAGDYYIKGDIEIDGTLLTNCGIKLKGNSSYNNPSTKKSFKLESPSEKHFDVKVPGLAEAKVLRVVF